MLLRLLPIKQLNEVTLRNVVAGAHIILELAQIPANNVGRLVISSSAGTVTVSEVSGLLTVKGVDSTATVSALRGVTLGPSEGFQADQCTIELSGGTVQVSTGLDRVTISGSGELTLPPPPAKADVMGRIARGLSASISKLVVSGQSSLKVRDSDIVIWKIVGADSDERAQLEVCVESGTSNALTSRPTLQVREIRNVSIKADSNALASVRLNDLRSARMVEFHAPLVVQFAANAEAEDVAFHKAGTLLVTLNAEPGSVIADASGDVALGKVSHVHVSASQSRLTIHLAEREGGESAQDPWKGLVLTGAYVQGGLEGRRILASMAQVYHFAPDTDDVPGRDQTAWALISGKRKVRYGGTDRQLHQDAEYVRELSRLSREKGAPGSISTRLAWCAYRLRAIKAQGSVERFALFVYRLLGYGERPVPAFVAWATLSLLLAGPVLAAGGHRPEWTGEAVERYMLEVGRLALGPFAGLGRGGGLDGGNMAEIAARAATSIPLVTGALALRNYVKSER